MRPSAYIGLPWKLYRRKYLNVLNNYHAPAPLMHVIVKFTSHLVSLLFFPLYDLNAE